MPKHDEQTGIRTDCDLDIAEESAWSIIEQRKWVPTPQLLFALKAYCQETIDKSTQ